MADHHRARAVFADLHHAGCFVIPNPWDVGSAVMLKHLGFRALATTSAGYAFSRGLPDTDWAVPRGAMLAHIAEMVGATDLPVNADFESGYAHDCEGLARNVRLCADTGVAGLSIEDATGDPEKPLYDFHHAVERVAAAAEALRGTGVLLTARCEALLVNHPAAVEEALHRLPAYAAAGADVLYAPGLRTPDVIQAAVEAVRPKPLNLLVSSPIGLSVEQIAALGVRRISLGSGFNRAAWGGFLRAARMLADHGRFDALGEAEPFDALNEFFRTHGRPTP
ncbi:isocitrate lyase/phosphoenolpyruvate mutase family protein (plasmid) [Azospirillum argentinense]|uniref:Isocitrate lyase/phosphoenolpyruvate mutase family protein n=1 Tax=Azospirillum argentinense TaxID=2970906 RepID=A0A4D8PR22_9PROT|nr:isocitrate lyase/phosphoenolpyruvate mutase family protein [Azospirillum argentinense]QCN97489.1 isocitrate lyase/phosphoenolpyruvate mutase family protein [Azospirillum argentinense]